jgi:hypothetical protein
MVFRIAKNNCGAINFYIFSWERDNMETISLALEFRRFNRMRIFMRIFDVIKKVQPTSDNMGEYFGCSLRM